MMHLGGKKLHSLPECIACFLAAAHIKGVAQ
jgi:hypothetical protein